jgi:hypothetical protein
MRVQKGGSPEKERMECVRLAFVLLLLKRKTGIRNKSENRIGGDYSNQETA